MSEPSRLASPCICTHESKLRTLPGCLLLLMHRESAPTHPHSLSPGEHKTLLSAPFFQGRESERNGQRRRLQCAAVDQSSVGRRERRCAAPGRARLEQQPWLCAHCHRCLSLALLQLREKKKHPSESCSSGLSKCMARHQCLKSDRKRCLCCCGKHWSKHGCALAPGMTCFHCPSC